MISKLALCPDELDAVRKQLFTKKADTDWTKILTDGAYGGVGGAALGGLGSYLTSKEQDPVAKRRNAMNAAMTGFGLGGAAGAGWGASGGLRDYLGVGSGGGAKPGDGPQTDNQVFTAHGASDMNLPVRAMEPAIGTGLGTLVAAKPALRSFTAPNELMDPKEAPGPYLKSWNKPMGSTPLSDEWKNALTKGLGDNQNAMGIPATSYDHATKSLADSAGAAGSFDNDAANHLKAIAAQKAVLANLPPNSSNLPAEQEKLDSLQQLHQEAAGTADQWRNFEDPTVNPTLRGMRNPGQVDALRDQVSSLGGVYSNAAQRANPTTLFGGDLNKARAAYNQVFASTGGQSGLNTLRDHLINRSDVDLKAKAEPILAKLKASPGAEAAAMSLLKTQNPGQFDAPGVSPVASKGGLLSRATLGKLPGFGELMAGTKSPKLQALYSGAGQLGEAGGRLGVGAGVGYGAGQVAGGLHDAWNKTHNAEAIKDLNTYHDMLAKNPNLGKQ